MKISCIIPTRNRCSMVLEAIASIILQDCGALEIIVVDDGSTDITCEAISSSFPEVRLVRTNGEGPGPARNAGVEASGGDVLMFLDSDDLWYRDHARKLADVLERGYEVAYGMTENRDLISKNRFLIPEKGMIREGDCFDQLTKWCFLVPSSVAVRREAFQTVNGFDDLACGEDWLFFLKLAARFPFGFAGSEPITTRKLHRESLSFLNDREKLLAMLGQVFNLLEQEPRTTKGQLSHCKKLHAWTAANSSQWSTVQDWYLAMKREAII